MRDQTFREAVDRFKERIDIAAVVGRRVAMNGRGMGRCPFHDDGTPSLSVNGAGRYFHCFACGAGGDVIRFIELFERANFMEAVKMLANETGVAAPGWTAEDAERAKEARAAEDVLADAAGFYHRSLSEEARRYLEDKRGLTVETIRRFQVGQANGGLRDFLVRERGHSPEVCVKAGVLAEREGKILDYFFGGRIIFPNWRRGRVVHLSGRAFPDGGEPKYLHLPGPVEYLFHEDALSGAKDILIAEGPPDTLTLAQAGYAAVGVLGAGGFKAAWGKRFERCERVYVCLDGDGAGNGGAMKTAEKLGDQARIVKMPDGTDANDFYMEDREGFRERFDALLKEAVEPVRFVLEGIPEDVDKVELCDRLEPMLKMLAGMDGAKAEAYLSGPIRERFGLKAPDVAAHRKTLKTLRKETEGEEGKEKGKQAAPNYIALFDGLVDVVEHEGAPAFLVKEGDGLEIVKEKEIDGTVYAPPPRDQIRWLLPRGENVLKHYEAYQDASQREIDGALYEDLVEYFKGASELPSEGHYDWCAAWAMHTFIQEKAQYSPYLYLFAVPARGKTRTGKAALYASYRGLHVESLRDPYIVRMADRWGATLFFDVMDLWAKAEKHNAEDILLLRYERGATVARVQYPERGAHRDVVFYNIFGPTIIGTNRPVHEILGTRAVQFKMQESRRQFENDVTPENALELKERLCAFRGRWLDKDLPDIPKPAHGRLGDILKPIMQVVRAVAPEREPVLRDLIEEIQADRLVEKAESMEAQIVRTVVELEGVVESGKLSIKQIEQKLNDGKPDRHKMSDKSIGKILAAMGLDKKRTGAKGAVSILWNPEKIERLKGEYGLNGNSETSEISELGMPVVEASE